MNNETSGRRKPRHGRRLGWGRQALLLAALALIVMGVVGGTVAYLVTSTTPVVNTFDPGYVTCEIQETFDGTTKSNVAVKNTGNTDAYIRATIIVTWKDADGNISAISPRLGQDYRGDINIPDWQKYDEYYYYTKGAVKPGDVTSKLLDNVTVIGTNDGYTLSVEILAEAIQSSPDSAVKEAWGDGALALVKSN